MKRLIEQRHAVRHNLVAVIGVCLTVYFAYHAILGERSALRLMAINHAVERVSEDVEHLHRDRVALESRVAKMRPGQVDRDLLEERARLVLGFRRPDEKVWLQTN